MLFSWVTGMYCWVTDNLPADWISFKGPAGNEWVRETLTFVCVCVNPSLMPSGHIFGSFDNKPVGHKAVSELLFYGSVYRTYRQWNNTVLKAPFPCSESCSLSDTQASTLTCKCTSVPRIHSHTQATCTHCETNEGNSSPSIPFHGEACWLWRQCVFTLVSTLLAIFAFLSLQWVCVRLLGVFTYITVSQYAYVYAAAFVTQLSAAVIQSVSELW